jgi:hypothetical protein
MLSMPYRRPCAATMISSNQKPTERLATVLKDVRQQLPYPEELESVAEPDALEQLAVEVMRPASQAKLLAWAQVLPSRKLRLVFPLLAKQEQRSEFTNRLNTVLRERACISLLRVGYVTFQRHYPHPLVAAAVDSVWRILQIRGIRHDPILQDLLPLTSRSLINRTCRRVLDQRLSLSEFINYYHIDPKLPFGATLCSQLFRNSNAELYTDSALLFEESLLQAEPKEQAVLLSRFLQQEKLAPAVFDQYCQIIYDRCGGPEDGQPIWEMIRPKECSRFETWLREATIGSHFSGNPEYARFFLRFRNYIQSASEQNRDTLLIRFPKFTVTHSHRWPDTAMYRSLVLEPDQIGYPKPDPADNLKGISPADPRRPHRLPEEALRLAATGGQVLLLLDPAGSKQSAVFLEFALRGGKRHFG